MGFLTLFDEFQFASQDSDITVGQDGATCFMENNYYRIDFDSGFFNLSRVVDNSYRIEWLNAQPLILSNKSGSFAYSDITLSIFDLPYGGRTVTSTSISNELGNGKKLEIFSWHDKSISHSWYPNATLTFEAYDNKPFLQMYFSVYNDGNDSNQIIGSYCILYQMVNSNDGGFLVGDSVQDMGLYANPLVQWKNLDVLATWDMYHFGPCVVAVSSSTAHISEIIGVPTTINAWNFRFASYGTVGAVYGTNRTDIIMHTGYASATNNYGWVYAESGTWLSHDPLYIEFVNNDNAQSFFSTFHNSMLALNVYSPELRSRIIDQNSIGWASWVPYGRNIDENLI